jgi:hypothetical protein
MTASCVAIRADLDGGAALVELEGGRGAFTANLSYLRRVSVEPGIYLQPESNGLNTRLISSLAAPRDSRRVARAARRSDPQGLIGALTAIVTRSRL